MTHLLGELTGDTPSIFEPLDLRGGTIKYRSLDKYMFSLEEKMWVCQFLGSESGMHPRQQQQRLVAFSNRYSLRVDGLHEWMSQYKRSEMTCGSYCVVPRTYLDEAAVAAVNGFPATRGANENETDYKRRFHVFLNDQLAICSTR